MVKPVSPYLLRPLRTLAEVLRELGQPGSGETAPDTRAKASPSPAPAPAAAPKGPKDTVMIAGVAQPIAPAEPTPPSTGGQLDVEV